MTQRLDSSSPGLRERKRRDTKEQILTRAIASFRKLGIRGAHLGEIARVSGVSQATLYNYFPNKSALAEAWVRGEIDQALRAMSAELGARGLRRAMRSFCRELAAVACGHEDTPVRLEAWRESGRARIQPLRSDHPLVKALARWQKSERVRRDIDAAAIAMILMESVEGGLIDGLRQALDAPALAQVLRTRVDLILDGARKRNERVAAPLASRTPAASQAPAADKAPAANKALAANKETVVGWATRPVRSR